MCEILEYPSAYIGMARLLEGRRNFTELRQVLYTLIKKVPTFLPGYIEYCKAYLKGHDWVHCMEHVQRTLLLQVSLTGHVNISVTRPAQMLIFSTAILAFRKFLLYIKILIIPKIILRILGAKKIL